MENELKQQNIKINGKNNAEIFTNISEIESFGKDGVQSYLPKYIWCKNIFVHIFHQ